MRLAARAAVHFGLWLRARAMCRTAYAQHVCAAAAANTGEGCLLGRNSHTAVLCEQSTAADWQSFHPSHYCSCPAAAAAVAVPDQALSSVLYAASRVPDLPELTTLHKMFAQKYGKVRLAAAGCLVLLSCCSCCLVMSCFDVHERRYLRISTAR